MGSSFVNVVVSGADRSKIVAFFAELERRVDDGLSRYGALAALGEYYAENRRDCIEKRLWGAVQDEFRFTFLDQAGAASHRAELAAHALRVLLLAELPLLNRRAKALGLQLRAPQETDARELLRGGFVIARGQHWRAETSPALRLRWDGDSSLDGADLSQSERAEATLASVRCQCAICCVTRPDPPALEAMLKGLRSGDRAAVQTSAWQLARAQSTTWLTVDAVLTAMERHPALRSDLAETLECMAPRTPDFVARSKDLVATDRPGDVIRVGLRARVHCGDQQALALLQSQRDRGTHHVISLEPKASANNDINRWEHLRTCAHCDVEMMHSEYRGRRGVIHHLWQCPSCGRRVVPTSAVTTVMLIGAAVILALTAVATFSARHVRDEDALMGVAAGLISVALVGVLIVRMRMQNDVR